jgi:hypothetical protein
MFSLFLNSFSTLRHWVTLFLSTSKVVAVKLLLFCFANSQF